MVRSLLVIAIPASIQFIVSYLQVSTDMAFIGRYDPLGLSAIQNVRSSFFLVLAFFVSFTHGTRILIARALGAGRPRKAQGIGSTSLFYNQLISFGYLGFWTILGYRFLGLLGATDVVLEMGWSYLRIFSLIFLFHGAFLTSTAIFQGRGITGPITIAAVIRAGVNIPLDWILIYGRFGLPEMGIEGAALATLVSEAFGAVYLISLLLGSKDFPLSRRRKRDSKVLLSIAALGVPAGLVSLAWQFGNAGAVSYLNRLSPYAAGHYGVTQTLKTLNISLYNGIGVATMTLVAMAYGAKDYVRARNVVRVALMITLCVCSCVGLVFIFAPRLVLGLFIRDQQVINSLVVPLAIVALTLFPQAFNITNGSALLARGESLWFLGTQVVGTILLLVLGYLMMFPLGLGLIGLLWVVFFDESWRGIANTWYLHRISKRDFQINRREICIQPQIVVTNR